MRPIATILFTCLIGAPACFRHVERQGQLPDTAYLTFPGVAPGSSVRAEGQRTYNFEVNSSDQRFAVQAGRYEVQVYSGEHLVARRVVFLASGETKEISP